MTDVREKPVVEKRGSGIGLILAILLTGIVAIAAWFIVSRESGRDRAVENAARSVGTASDKVGAAVDKVANTIGN
jgi:hypothetical protein